MDMLRRPINCRIIIIIIIINYLWHQASKLSRAQTVVYEILSLSVSRACIIN